MSEINRLFIVNIQNHVARIAVGPSAARGQGSKNVVANAREYFTEVNLKHLATKDKDVFPRKLDLLTKKLQNKLPHKATSWGLARKLTNIFLRDCVYNYHLRHYFKLNSIESFLEIPLDSITAIELRRITPEINLPKWRGVKYLNRKTSEKYQFAAKLIAHKNKIHRVHLDAVIWGSRNFTLKK